MSPLNIALAIVNLEGWHNDSEEIKPSIGDRIIVICEDSIAFPYIAKVIDFEEITNHIVVKTLRYPGTYYMSKATLLNCDWWIKIEKQEVL